MKIIKSRSGFSIIEASIVIFVTSLLLIFIIKSSFLIEKSKVSKAQFYTKNSIINQSEELFLWLESSFLNSFNEDEAENFEDLSSSEIALGKGSVTKWFDRNPNPVPRKNALANGSAPKYVKNCISYLPCLKFESNFLEIQNSTSSVLSDYTVIIVDKRASDISMPIIGSDSKSSINQSLEIGYLNSNTVYWSQGGSSSDQKEFFSSNLTDSNVNFHLFINSTNKVGSSDLKYYLNGNLISSSNPTTTVDFSNTTINSILKIGKSDSSHFNGSIGELIILPYAISKNERVAAIHYIKKKWSIK